MCKGSAKIYFDIQQRKEWRDVLLSNAQLLLLFEISCEECPNLYTHGHGCFDSLFLCLEGVIGSYPLEKVPHIEHQVNQLLRSIPRLKEIINDSLKEIPSKTEIARLNTITDILRIMMNSIEGETVFVCRECCT